jgi:hypothetical protein
MKISHEVPLHLLKWSKSINDYEYILPYFYFRYPEYKEFYLQCKAEGRFSILDNGLFEGETYTDDVLIELINEVKPDIFIIPDEWNDWSKTYDHAKEWKTLLLQGNINPGTKFMIVLQGETFEEIRRLYKFSYDLGYRHFAFNHSSIAYDKLFPHKNKLVSKMMGRIQMVHLMSELMEKDDVYVHLLGASLPQEFMYYEEYNFLKSVDTSNPILVGANKETYKNFGSLLTKPKDKMEKFFEQDMMPNVNYIEANVTAFRKIINKE